MQSCKAALCVLEALRVLGLDGIERAEDRAYEGQKLLAGGQPLQNGFASASLVLIPFAICTLVNPSHHGVEMSIDAGLKLEGLLVRCTQRLLPRMLPQELNVVQVFLG